MKSRNSRLEISKVSPFFISVFLVFLFIAMPTMAFANAMPALENMISEAGQMEELSQEIKSTVLNKFPFVREEREGCSKKDALEAVALMSIYIDLNRAQICMSQMTIMFLAYINDPKSYQGKQLLKLLQWDYKVLLNIKDTIYVYKDVTEGMSSKEKALCSNGFVLIDKAVKNVTVLMSGSD